MLIYFGRCVGVYYNAEVMRNLLNKIFRHSQKMIDNAKPDENTFFSVTVANTNNSYDQAVADAIKYSGHLGTSAQQDKQIKSIRKAERLYVDKPDELILFWEKLWADGGLKFNGVKWHYRLVELYYKTKRYDDAWRLLNEFVHIRPRYITNTRKWQIKILKREKKDYSRIQQLLDNNQ